MRVLVFCLLLGCNYVLHAQIPDLNATIQYVKNEHGGYFSDTSLCEKYYKAALRDIDRKNLEYLKISSFDFNEDTLAFRFKSTEWMWIQENTPFVQNREWYKEDSLAFSDVIPAEAGCYDFVFWEYKAQRFGKDFSADVIRIADSLNNIGYGYIPANFSRKNIEKYFKKESAFKLDYTIFENPDSYYSTNNAIILAEISINELGEITKITCWDKRSQGPIVRSLSSENMYVKEIERLLGIAGKINPAFFKRKPVSGEVTIYFPFIK